MSVCEYMLRDVSASNSDDSNLRNELIWGRKYRNLREADKRRPLAPLRAPADVPFRLCRARATKKRKKKTKLQGSAGGKKGASDIEKPSLLDRSIMSQNEYMEFLSIPSPRFCDKPAVKKPPPKCELEPCPPRLVKLAVPNKRRVFANWKDYQTLLPAEMLLRYEQILHTDHNLEPREARYYYKTLDRQHRKKMKEKKRSEKTKELERGKRPSWTTTQIDALASAVVDYVRDEPLFALNYKQMLISDGVLDGLDASRLLKKPSRKTGNCYKKTVIEIADKMAVWIDAMTRFVDVQAVESDEDIPPLSISSLSEYEDDDAEGEEEESEEESESEMTREELMEREEEFVFKEDVWIEEHLEGLDLEEMVGEDKLPAELEHGFGTERDDRFDEEEVFLDEELLAKLVQILAQGPEDFLDSEVDAGKMPGLRYRDILAKLEELRLGGEVPKTFLEEVVMEWALKNDPDKVDQKMMDKIREVSAILNDWVSAFRGGVDDDDGAAEDTEGAVDQDKKERGEEKEEAPGNVAGAEGEDAEETTTQEANDDTTEDVTEETNLGTIEEAAKGPDQEPIEQEDLGTTEETEDVKLVEGATDEEVVKSVEEEEERDDDYRISEEDDLYEAVATEEEFDVQTEEETPKVDDLAVLDKEPSRVTQTFDFVEDVPTVGDDVHRLPPSVHEETEEERESPPTQKPEMVAPSKVEPVTSQDRRGVIRGHRPAKVYEHSADAVCCLSLKTWAVWLLEITHNAHNWTRWMGSVIAHIKEFALTLRRGGALKKSEWRRFANETEENVVAWRQYSAHVKELSQSIVDNFRGRRVRCCPKCVDDHLISNVATAHETLRALTEAISCAEYWQRSLDTLVEKTSRLAGTEARYDPARRTVSLEVVPSPEPSGSASLEALAEEGESTGESVYEIEAI
ncbi:uncharacterized protein LOC132699779 [Cylas formicarius]|uniref:uncharacterized protein LOC132699779 n=1 Tax=Cylas formicarius TaxID=197179 RepID=UPI00295853A7|nr:uncharacterized protein LOC132699779 [Cylas formicarius]